MPLKVSELIQMINELKSIERRMSRIGKNVTTIQKNRLRYSNLLVKIKEEEEEINYKNLEYIK